MPDGWAWYKPRMAYFHTPQDFPDKNSDYGQGFNDGCQSNMVFGAGAYTFLPIIIDGWKMTGKNPDGSGTKHPKVENKSTYFYGFRDGAEVCFYYFDWEAV